MKKTISLCLALACAACALADGPGKLSPRASIAAQSAARSRADSYISAYITANDAQLDRSALAEMGCIIDLDLGSVITARVPVSALYSIAETAGVKYVEASAPAQQTLDMARPEIGIADVQAGKGLDQPYRGSGVVVGIVDSGFDYSHPAFYDAEGKLRIKRIWEQETVAKSANAVPEAFGYGTELTTAAEIIAAGGDIRNNSHGTHVASIAAGSDPVLDGALTGMAPDADIVLVSLVEEGTNNVNISNALAYIFKYADEQHKPCVINLSLGSHAGPHDGTSTFDTIANALQGPGRLIVGAAGNYRAEKFHVRHQFAEANDAPLRTFAKHKNALDIKTPGVVEIWGGPGLDMEVSLIAYKTNTGEETERVTAYPLPDGTATLSLGRNISGSFDVATEISPLNGKPHVLISAAISSIRSHYAIAIEVKSKSSGTVDIWADNVTLELESKGIDGFTAPSAAGSVGEIGGTAERILTVGAYTTRNEYRLMGQTTEYVLPETIGDICSFSSCGPTADGRIKPQVAAPGCFISSAVSGNDKSGTILMSYADVKDDGIVYYGYMQGTSMAAPFVTGIVATWLQAWPEMDPESLVAVIKASARKDDFTGPLAAPNNDWGYGKIDALEGLRQAIALKEEAGLGSTLAADEPNAIIALDGDAAASVIFTRDMAQTELTVTNASGMVTCCQPIDKANAGETMRVELSKGLNIIKIGPCAYKVIR